MTPSGNAQLHAVHTFVDELWRLGVREVCISPGSRSTPVTMSFALHGGFEMFTILDERSASFFALGMARRLQRPVAFVCTSGTAVANVHPAVMEASLSGVPLVVITADRPPELHHVGANQTVGQEDLYGRLVKLSITMPVPEDTRLVHRFSVQAATRAVATAMQAPVGPVHINWPLREPLIPAARVAPPGDASGLRIVTGRLSVAPDVAEALARRITQSSRPLLVCGPQTDPRLARAMRELAARARIPLLADPLSQVRTCAEPVDGAATSVIDRYDWFVGPSFGTKAKPDLVIRFGRTPTSKGLLQYLQTVECPQVVVSDSSEFADASLSVTELWVTDGLQLVAGLLVSDAIGTPPSVARGRWTDAWLKWNAETHSVATQVAMADRPDSDHQAQVDEHGDVAMESGTGTRPQTAFEGRLWLELMQLLKNGMQLFVGNSMPVRDLDGFLQTTDKQLTVYANRGVSGIDGVVSSAAGTAAATRQPTVLVIGDVSFHHDINGLWSSVAYQLPLVVVLVNNQGGGIFSGLPQADVPDAFAYFETPHTMEFRGMVEGFGGVWEQALSWVAFRDAVQRGFERKTLTVVEIRTSSRTSTELRREIRRQVAELAWEGVADAD